MLLKTSHLSLPSLFFFAFSGALLAKVDQRVSFRLSPSHSRPSDAQQATTSQFDSRRTRHSSQRFMELVQFSEKTVTVPSDPDMAALAEAAMITATSGSPEKEDAEELATTVADPGAVPTEVPDKMMFLSTTGTWQLASPNRVSRVGGGGGGGACGSRTRVDISTGAAIAPPDYRKEVRPQRVTFAPPSVLNAMCGVAGPGGFLRIIAPERPSRPATSDSLSDSSTSHKLSSGATQFYGDSPIAPGTVVSEVTSGCATSIGFFSPIKKSSYFSATASPTENADTSVAEETLPSNTMTIPGADPSGDGDDVQPTKSSLREYPMPVTMAHFVGEPGSPFATGSSLVGSAIISSVGETLNEMRTATPLVSNEISRTSVGWDEVRRISHEQSLYDSFGLLSKDFGTNTVYLAMRVPTLRGTCDGTRRARVRRWRCCG